MAILELSAASTPNIHNPIASPGSQLANAIVSIPLVQISVRSGGLAEFERHLILARTDEGRKRAQGRGVRFGRKLKLERHQRQEVITRREAGEPLAEIERSYNVSPSTISRLTSEHAIY